MEIWELFQKRYKIKHIVEFYASTEGNIALFNSADKVGALGSDNLIQSPHSTPPIFFSTFLKLYTSTPTIVFNNSDTVPRSSIDYTQWKSLKFTKTPQMYPWEIHKGFVFPAGLMKLV